MGKYAVPAGILTLPVQRWDLDKLRQSDPNIDTRKVLSAEEMNFVEELKQNSMN